MNSSKLNYSDIHRVCTHQLWDMPAFTLKGRMSVRAGVSGYRPPNRHAMQPKTTSNVQGTMVRRLDDPSPIDILWQARAGIQKNPRKEIDDYGNLIR
jgi:hypothetical protein